ncbi:sucrose nonfermenting 4-like protein isoform X2 [Zingiber officinale]|uniref:sucrose nonfermenting 4-like protein isoform X2 n=1 Tax=Zingiber officinale TaxID=94328 RepID=UPI001C4D1A3D|nr:sucrose nonfermenting 4-like protein isoform X2 [Zingiber officinale]
MISQITENSHVGAGVAGGMLSPTRFVWPYGGRRVFVTGSFTGWSEHVPMSPVEGCPTVFQVICRLSPGLHQYKFYVDGEWRHDEHQPFVTGNYGLVNTIYILPEANPLAALPSPGTPNVRMGMDVDNETFQHDEALLEGTIQGGSAKISEEDIKTSRVRISLFLSSHTAYDLLPDSGKVIALDVNLPVKQAFHILYEQGISVAPLWDSLRCQFVGVLSALDFILILQELGNRGSNLREEELETHTISAWKEGKHQLLGQLDNHGRPLQSHIIHVGPYDSLKDVAVTILQNKVSTVPIMHPSAQDGSFPQLLHLASLSGILKCICRHFRHSISSLPILQQPICKIPLGTWDPRIEDQSGRPLVMLRRSGSLSLALSLLIQAKVSSIPIVDENDSFMDIYSRSDITALAKDRIYAQIHLDKMSIQQALQLGHDAPSSHGGFDGQRCQMCLRTDPLLKVMERLSNPGVRRVIIVEAGSKRVEGIISLSDVFKFLLS